MPKVCANTGEQYSYQLSFSCAWQQMHAATSAIHRGRNKTTKKPKQSLWLYLVTTNPHSMGKAFVYSSNVWFCSDWDVNYLSRNLIGMWSTQVAVLDLNSCDPNWSSARKRLSPLVLWAARSKHCTLGLHCSESLKWIKNSWKAVSDPYFNYLNLHHYFFLNLFVNLTYAFPPSTS